MQPTVGLKGVQSTILVECSLKKKKLYNMYKSWVAKISVYPH